jgi:hypothetical protein
LDLLLDESITVEFKPAHFIDQPIQVVFNNPSSVQKSPTCPDQFIWEGEVFQITEQINEWRDYRRRGRMARNMQPQHAEVAVKRGSWGVGIFYFRVRTDRGKYFDIYYDRSPKNVDDRMGSWFLYRELNLIK